MARLERATFCSGGSRSIRLLAARLEQWQAHIELHCMEDLEQFPSRRRGYFAAWAGSKQEAIIIIKVAGSGE